jgi:hypothetical protein
MTNKLGVGDYSPAHDVLGKNAEALAQANTHRQRIERRERVRAFLRDEFGQVPFIAWIAAVALIVVAVNLFLGRPWF